VYSTVDWLEPVFASVVSNGEIGEMRCFAAKHPEDALSTCTLHRGIRVIDTANSDAVVFNGVIVKNHIVYGGEAERFEVVAYNTADYLLHRINLHGQHRQAFAKEQSNFTLGFIDGAQDIADADVIHIDTPLIFNPDGEPNRHPQEFNWAAGSTFAANSDNKTYLFDAPFRKQYNATGDIIESVPWTLSTALAYLFNMYPAYWALSPNSYGDAALDIFATNGDPVISNVNLDGKSFLEALRILLIPHNYGFYVTPGIESGYQQIYFEYRGNPTYTKTVDLSPRGTNAALSSANLINADITYDGSAVVNNLTAVGDRIEVTTLAHTNPPTPVSTGLPTALKLVPGWKLSDLVWGPLDAHGNVNPYAPTFRRDYCNEYLITKRTDEYGTSAGIYGIGRLWLVNQGQSPTYDLENLNLSLGVHNGVDLRRLEQPELYDRNIENALINQTDIVVELSFDGGANWRVCERNWYRVLPNGMGIVFTNVSGIELLGYKWVNDTVPSGINYWQGLYNSYYSAGHEGSGLQIRIVCGVKSDERVKSVNPNDGAALPLAVERQFENTGYRKVVYNDMINDAIYYVDFPPARNVRDDTAALGEIADIQLANTNRLLVSGQFITTLGTIGEYAPLTAITGIANRLTFAFPPTILRVIYDFPSQHVHLVVDNRQVKSILKAAPVEGEDQRGHRFGIGALGAGGGNKVPFVPGIDSSMRDFYRRQAAGGSN
jgi:hypothetical protein